MEQLVYVFLLVYSSILQFPVGDQQAQSVPDLYTNTVENISSTATVFEDSVQNLYRAIGLERYDLSLEVFRYGMIGYYTLLQQGKLSDKKLLSIIDFSKSSTKKRFYTIDLEKQEVTYYTYVSHGKNTGEDEAKSFSNTVHSNQSSLGFYVTAETYIGSKGYSMKLDGVETGYNDKIRERAVVMHSAEYVSEYWIKQYGRLGRSQGCPALPTALAHEVIDAIKHHTAIFAYFNDETYLRSSAYLKHVLPGIDLHGVCTFCKLTGLHSQVSSHPCTFGMKLH